MFIEWIESQMQSIHICWRPSYFCASSFHFHCACDALKSVVSHSLLLPSWTLPMAPSVDRILAPETCVRLRRNITTTIMHYRKENTAAHENAFRQWDGGWGRAGVWRPIHTQYCDNNKINALLWFCSSRRPSSKLPNSFANVYCSHSPVYGLRPYVRSPCRA